MNKLSVFLTSASLAAHSFSLAFQFTETTDTIPHSDSSDSLSYGQTLVSDDSLEQLVEQAAGADESTLLDLLEDVFFRRDAGKVQATSRSRLSQKLQPSRGFREGGYIGTAIRSYQRLEIDQGKHFRGGFLVEKDAGESRLNDFTGGYLRIDTIGPVSCVVLGDYRIESGQGVALWRGFETQKGANVVLPVERRGRGLVSYSSSDENFFFRGTAMTVAFEDFSLTTFYSRKSLSASLDTLGNIASVYTTGYYRTDTEQAKRDNFSETVLGARGEYGVTSGSTLGITAYRGWYSRNFSLSDQQFTGNTLTVFASDYSFSLGTIQLLGEWVITNSVVGGISSIHLKPASFIDIVAAYRTYPAEFFLLHGNGFSEKGITTNERGWYVGLRLRPAEKIRISSYVDQFTFPSLSGSTVFAGGGNELFAQVEISALRRSLFTPRYRRKVTTERTIIIDYLGRPTAIDDRKIQQNMRLTMDYWLNPRTHLRTRLEYVDLEFQYLRRKEHGVMVYQDLTIQASVQLTVSARVAIFRTDSFDSGIAEFERDLPGVLTIPVLYGRGARWYLLARYSFLEWFQCSLKYSELIRDDVKTIGSGLDELPGNRDNRIGVQVDFSF